MSKINMANVKKTVYYLKRNGLKNTWYAVRERLDEKRNAPYCFTPVTETEKAFQRRESEKFKTTFSIVVPAYRTAEIYLTELMTSVIKQTYPRWELVIADATEDDSVERVMKQYQYDNRIRYIRLGENVDIATNTNRALAYATGDYIGLLDHDDVLTENALYEMVAAIEKGKKNGVEVKMLYSDEDKCNSDRTQYYEPHFKENFNLDLLLSNNYICHFLVMKSEFMKELKFRAEYSGAQDYDLVLRAAERLMNAEEKIVHIPLVLYHWRCHAASTAENPQSKQYAYDAGLRALQDFADRKGWEAQAEHLKHLGFYRLSYQGGPLTVRCDIGAVGGRLVAGKVGRGVGNTMVVGRDGKDVGKAFAVNMEGKTIGGRMSETGAVYYQGLPIAYSGYMHRASLTQDAEALDIRHIQVREELHALFKKVTGVSYQTKEDSEFFDVSLLPEGTDYVEISLKLSKAIREQGYRLLYLPTQIEVWKNS